VANQLRPPGAFAEFVAAASPRLLRAAWLLTGDAGRAEDLLQTAFARAWPHWRRISATGDPEAYVRRVLFTTNATWWRRRWRSETPTASLPDRPEPLDESDEVARREVVRGALATLTRGQRAVVVLRFVEDLSEVETARILGCSVGTVKSQTSRALSRLRDDSGLRALLVQEVSL
jgi:RNA polymerase sigma-70 factor (sigma-E family)